MSSPTRYGIETVPIESSLRTENERLARRNAELERANENLKRFAYVASHDLQEPLRVIGTYAELLRRNHAKDLTADALPVVDNMVNATRRVRELVADLLAFSISGADPEGSAGVVDLNDVLKAVIEDLKTAVDESNATIASDCLPEVNGYANDFVRVFQNLLSNAIKYRGKDTPRIQISVEQENGQFRFAVSDNGIGIDPEDQAQIFEPFKRLHGKNVPGTGLGLAICERVIQRCGGRLWVESQPGNGATFLFTLPAPAAKSPHAGVA
jgi:light-regulated signal transduction histidine kinase (bacteriophytochrome)